MTDSPLTIAGKSYASRLIIGTGKYKTYAENAAALEASGAEIVTVAVRRVSPITSIRRRRPSCPTPPAASLPTKRSARSASRAKRAIGSW
jgi:thiazole synthase